MKVTLDLHILVLFLVMDTFKFNLFLGERKLSSPVMSQIKPQGVSGSLCAFTQRKKGNLHC